VRSRKSFCFHAKAEVSILLGLGPSLHPRLDSDLLMAAALPDDVGKAREFTYGARFELSEPWPSTG
jgi:hypothetical protein